MILEINQHLRCISSDINICSSGSSSNMFDRPTLSCFAESLLRLSLWRCSFSLFLLGLLLCRCRFIVIVSGRTVVAAVAAVAAVVTAVAVVAATPATAAPAAPAAPAENCVGLDWYSDARCVHASLFLRCSFFPVYFLVAYAAIDHRTSRLLSLLLLLVLLL